MGNRDRNQDDDAVRALESRYDAPWNTGDIDALMPFFTEDAIVISPLGVTARGHEEIREHIGGYMSGPGRDSSHASEIVRVTFASDDVAIVDGMATLDSIPTGTALSHRFVDVAVRRNGEWLLAHVRACGLEEER